MSRIGFLVNPIAGMGGRVGLKGTDNVLEEALRRGATPVTPERAERFLRALGDVNAKFFVPSGIMGEDYIKKFNLKYKVIYNTPEITTATDTINTVRALLDENVDVVVFVGGDGTARDVASVVSKNVPILGIPSGVKMYSSVFAVSPEKGAYVLKAFIEHKASIKDGEVLDIDEEAYRHNRFSVKLYAIVKVPFVSDMVQSSKSVYHGDDEQEKNDIAEFFVEEIYDPKTLYFFGAGTTVARIAEVLGVKNTLLGVDAIYNQKNIGADLSEKEILTLLKKYKNAVIVISPIGSQGFIFGRGNQQFSEEVIKMVGKNNILVVATPTKLRDLDTLKADISLNIEGYIKVLCGYQRYKIMKIINY